MRTARTGRAIPFAARIIPALLAGIMGVGLAPLVGTAQEPAAEAPPLLEEQDTPLPKLLDLPVPTMAELLHERPVDWIVLIEDYVLAVEAIEIRPNAIEVLNKKIKESYSWPQPATEAQRDRQFRARQRLRYLDVVPVASDGGTVYQLDIEKYARDIVYHEDLMLRRVDLLLDDGKLQEAFEMLLVLERRHADWPGAADRLNRLTFLEAQARCQKGDGSAALASLEALHRRVPDYSGLSKELGRVVDRLMTDAVAADDYRQARHFLARLERIQPEHEVAADWTRRLTEQAGTLLEQAEEASQAGQHDRAAALAGHASRVWPNHADLREVHRRTTSRFQRLAVGVIQLPRENASPLLRTRADDRFEKLLRMDFFEVDRVDGAAHYTSRFFEQWEPENLGRRIVFTLRRDRPPWDSQPLVTAASVALLWSARLDPFSPYYDERFASTVDSIRVRSPLELEVDLARIPVRTEALFAFPFVPVSDRDALYVGQRFGGAHSQANSDGTAHVAADGRYIVQERSEGRIVLRRSLPEPDGLPNYHVAEIEERRYAAYDKAVQALLRGDVSFLPRIPSWVVDILSDDDRFFVNSYALPTTHILQFHPDSPLSQTSELRRALAYGLDRPAILKETVLRDPEARRGRVVSAAWPMSSDAYNPLLPPREHDLPLALSLTLAARKQFDGRLPPLKLLCVPDPIARQAAQRLVEQWRRLGITVELVSEKDAAAAEANGDWDLAYRQVSIVEPLREIWPLLTLEPNARVEALARFPDWLRQELIELDTVGSWEAAMAVCHRLQEHLQAEALVIPLWEVDEYQVIRKNIRGFSSRPVHPYQYVEQWIIQPWYPTETP